MSQELFQLTKNEREIMELLWVQDRPLSRSEIIELSTNRSWKASSIHILLNQLLNKDAIRVDGFVKTGKNYGRTFSSAITEEAYQVMQFKNGVAYKQSKNSALVSFIAALIQDETLDEKSLNCLGALLDAKRG